MFHIIVKIFKLNDALINYNVLTSYLLVVLCIMLIVEHMIAFFTLAAYVEQFLYFVKINTHARCIQFFFGRHRTLCFYCFHNFEIFIIYDSNHQQPGPAQRCYGPALRQKKKLISKLLFFFKKSDKYMFLSIFKNKSMEIKILSYKKNLGPFSYIKYIFFLNRALIY